ncbi:hypothetical protein D0T53_13140 [Dysgonomonas sp. 216]|nr:hypothetical protein [Dysgonomonas sp. 216]
MADSSKMNIKINTIGLVFLKRTERLHLDIMQASIIKAHKTSNIADTKKTTKNIFSITEIYILKAGSLIRTTSTCIESVNLTYNAYKYNYKNTILNQSPKRFDESCIF